MSPHCQGLDDGATQGPSQLLLLLLLLAKACCTTSKSHCEAYDAYEACAWCWNIKLKQQAMGREGGTGRRSMARYLDCACCLTGRSCTAATIHLADRQAGKHIMRMHQGTESGHWQQQQTNKHGSAHETGRASSPKAKSWGGSSSKGRRASCPKGWSLEAKGGRVGPKAGRRGCSEATYGVDEIGDPLASAGHAAGQGSKGAQA